MFDSNHSVDSAHAARGVSVLEVLVAIGIIAVVGIFVSVSVTQFISAREDMLHDTQQLYAAEAGYEMVRFVRDADWSTFSALAYDTPQYLIVSTTSIAFGTEPELLAEGSARSFVVEQLYRNLNGDVVAATATGATPDPDGRVVRIAVGSERGTTTMESILTNLFAQ